MIDYHLHTDYTKDAEGKVEDYCRVAKEKNLKEIAFTNHFNIIKLNSPGESILPEQISQYFQEIEKARKEFGLKIKFGLEVDYWKSEHKKIERILNEHEFDFLLGSVHYVDNISIAGKPENSINFFKGKSLQEAYEIYFDRVIETLESNLFDILAHPDYIRKNVIKFFGKELPFEKYRNLVDKVIETLIANDIGIEINTSGFFHGTNDFFPSHEFLKLCLDSGVKVVIVGSDAHKPERVGDKVKEALERLKDIGFKKIYVYNKRRKKRLPIENLI
ncbi:MAG: histidinol-phosphatase [Candidatus Aenigmarchaeota archaeon]|nr:histidinol-phosphatase [Candidatus Aenigmarchaeota archaeon]